MSKRCALACVESAKSVAGVFPEGSDFDLALLYNVGPWWNMSHILVQSFTILLLEMIYEPVQLPHDRREIMLSLKKLLRWLRAMQTNSLVAARAYIILMKVIRAVGSNTNMVSPLTPPLLLHDFDFTVSMLNPCQLLESFVTVN